MKSLVLPLNRTALGYVRSDYGVLGWTNPPFPPLSTIPSFVFTSSEWNMLPSEPKHFLLRKTLSPAAAHAVEADGSRFLSIKLPKWKYVEVHATGFPPALWDEGNSGFHLAGCTEFIGFVIIQITITNIQFSRAVVEVQVACGYCQEIGGPWACFVPPMNKERIKSMKSSELRCAALLSQFRAFNDEARQNSWRGYQIARQHIFASNLENNPPFRLTRTNMRVDDLFNWVEYKAEDVDITKLHIGAHIECSNSTQVTGTGGEITVTIVDPNRLLNSGLPKMFS
jgi:hypothetical protein